MPLSEAAVEYLRYEYCANNRDIYRKLKPTKNVRQKE